MKKKSLPVKSVILILSIVLFSVSLNSQEWQWAELFGGPGDVEAVDIAFDNLNNVYVTGNYKGATTIDIGTDQLDPYGDWDIFLCSFASDGTYRWAVRIGGTDRENTGAITLDEDNNIFLVGSFKSDPVNFTASESLTNDNHYDSFLAKYDSDGNFIFAKRIFWGTDQERLFDISIDKTNDLLAMVGTFKVDLSYDDGESIQTVPVVGAKDQYIATYSYSGNFQDIAIFDATNTNTSFKNVNFCSSGGYFISGDITETINFSQSESLTGDATNSDAMLIKVNSNLDYLWARKGGGAGYDHANGSCYGMNEDVYLTGKCESTIQFDSTATQLSATLSGFGGADFYIAKYNTEGILQWVKRWGSAENDDGFGIVVNDLWIQLACIYSGEIILGQDTLSVDVPGNLNTGVALFGLTGDPLGAKEITGSGEDNGQAVDFDSDGNTYLAGYFSSPILTAGDLTLNNNSSTGVYDGFLAKYAYEFYLSESEHQNVLCHGGEDGEVTLATHFGTSPFSYTWEHDPGLNGPTATNLTAGIYEVIVTDAMADDDTLEIEITQPEKLITGDIQGAANVIEDEEEIYSVEGELNSNFEWIVAGGTILEGQGNDTINVQWGSSGAGSLAVSETDINGCQGDTSSIVVNIGASGISDVTGDDLKIYPNPFSNTTIIEFPNNDGGNYKLTLTDLSGKTVKVIENITVSRIELSRSDLSNGYYLIEISNKNRVFRDKILIK